MVYSCLNVCRKRHTLIGQLRGTFPNTEIECANRRKRLVLTSPLQAKEGDWLRVVGQDTAAGIVLDSFDVLSETELRLLLGFRKAARHFYSENKNVVGDLVGPKPGTPRA